MIQVLQTSGELHAARALLRARGLDFSDPRRAWAWRLLYRIRFRAPLPPADPLKSWDVAGALSVIEATLPDRATPILDMGCYNSEIIYVLHSLGYRSVSGCDLNPLARYMPYWHAVRYTCADLSATPYAGGTFGAITCLSVIEHGVPLEALVKEVERLLRPGGLFVFTTDFDATGHPHEIDPAYRIFGQPWRIYSAQELLEVIDAFRARGFCLLEPSRADLSHTERPVAWNGQTYTFALVALRKASD
jgi:SAM-dependent methyltransferase